jgi:hypothetical protein
MKLAVVKRKKLLAAFRKNKMLSADSKKRINAVWPSIKIYFFKFASVRTRCANNKSFDSSKSRS